MSQTFYRLGFGAGLCILFFAGAVAADPGESGVQKSRMINDFLSEVRKTSREEGFAVKTGEAERICFSTTSNVEECRAAIAKVRAELDSKLAKREKERKKSEKLRTVVDEKTMSNREVQRLATSPENRPRPFEPPPRPTR